jgi:Mg-chelatase subunit ChlD
MLPDLYQMLGVTPQATPQEIRRAFRRLARQYHPDMRPNVPNAEDHFRRLYHAYQVLISPEQRSRYEQAFASQQAADAAPAGWGASSPNAWNTAEWAAVPARPQPTLELRCTLSQSQVATLPSEQVLYVLSELLPMSGGQSLSSLPLNLCLVVDRSSSMRGEKLGAVKKALRQIIEQLEPEDILSLVAFDNYPEVLVRAERQQFPHVLSSVVDRLYERGGTTIGAALERALEEVSRFADQQMTSHLILLTDGRTYGDDARCLELARAAYQRGIGITTLGIGTEWNEQLLDQIAAESAGAALYLEHADDIITAMEQSVATVRSTLATNVRLALELEPQARVRRVTRVLPDIAELLDASAPEQQWASSSSIQLAPGQVAATAAGSGLGLLWEVLLPANVRGPYPLGQISMQYDLPSAQLAGASRSDAWAVTFVEPHLFTPAGVSPRVHQVLEYLTAYRLQQRAHALARQGHPQQASKLLHTAALRLHDASQDDLAGEARAQAERLARSGQLDRSAMLRLHFGTKNLGRRPR